MAYAGAEFAEKVLRALKGEKGIVAPSFVHLTADASGGDVVKKEIGKEIDYFSAPVELGVRLISRLSQSTFRSSSLECDVDGLRRRMASPRSTRSAS